MIFAHRTLQPDNIITGAAAIRDYEGNFSSIAIAQGTTMHIIDITASEYPIIESYPFLSPIYAIESAKSDNRPIFILLENLNWFIFELPKIVRYGSLQKPHYTKCNHFIQKINQYSYHYSDDILYQSSTLPPNAIQNIKFAESRVPHSSHPHYFAIQVYHNVIHVISIDEGRPPYEIHTTEPNIVDIAFFGPFTCSTRLAVLSDSSQNDYRILNLYSLKDESPPEFTLDTTVNLPPDAYHLLPLHPEIHSVITVFTNDGLIRITANEGLETIVEHLTAYMPPIILNASHFYDDIYLLCDSCGGLTGANFPIEGPISTENMKIIGPSSDILVFDKNHFLITSPFGDSIIYNFCLKNNSFNLAQSHHFESTGPIKCLEFRDDGLVCGSGIDENTSIRLFEKAVSCKKLAEIPVLNCLSIFIASGPNINSIYICMCFYDSSHILLFDGESITPVEWRESKLPSVTTILFADVESGILHLTEDDAIIRDRKTGEIISAYPFDSKIVSASLSESNLIIANEMNVIQILDSNDLHKVKRWKLNKKILLISGTDDFIAVYLIDNTVFLFYLSDQKPLSISLPYLAAPVSMSIISQDLIIIGTATGYLFKITDSLTNISSENVGEGKIVIHKFVTRKNEEEMNILICSGDPPFQLVGDERNFISACPCEDIGRALNFLVCLQREEISIYKVDESLIGTTKVKQSIPYMLSFTYDPEGCTIVHKDSSSFSSSFNSHLSTKSDSDKKTTNQSIIKFKRGVEVSRFDFPNNNNDYKISFCKLIELEGQNIIVIGDDKPSITLLDESMNKMCWLKTLGTPYTATVYLSYLVISREGSIDFYQTKFLDTQIEMDRVLITEAPIMILDFIVIGKFLVASDAMQALTVYSIDESNGNGISSDADSNADAELTSAARTSNKQIEISVVYCDHSKKQLTKLVLFQDFIFAASLSENIFAYKLLSDGKLEEIGGFKCDSRVLSFAVNDRCLFYGTECGGIKMFEIIEDDDFIKIRDQMKYIDITFIADRIPSLQFQWSEENPFVDIDNLALLKQIPRKELISCLMKAGVKLDKFNQMIH